MKMLYCAWKE